MTARDGNLGDMDETHHRRLVERLIDPSYARNLRERSVEDLRALREESREGENELSFERRLCQARIDILNAELARREGRSEGSLVENLPNILRPEAPSSTSPLPERAPDFSIPRNADIPRRRVEEVLGEEVLANLSNLPTEEVRQGLRSLEEHERAVSERRKQVQDVMDRIQSEIVRRYASGEADPASLVK